MFAASWIGAGFYASAVGQVPAVEPACEFASDMSIAVLLRPRGRPSAADRGIAAGVVWTWSRTRQELIVWAAAFLLSLGQWRHAAFFFGNCAPSCDMSDVIRAVQAEQGVLQGYPHWRYFQSRLLGPLAEKGLNVLFGVNFLVAHMIVAVVVLTACGAVMFYAGRAVGGRQAGWSALLAFESLFALLMARPWLYIWDYFLLLLTAVFMVLVIRRAPWWAFVILMGVAFFNHEAALFIGVWMVAQALADAWAERRLPDWGLLVGGIIGNLNGILLIEYLRATLLNREIGWDLFQDAREAPSSWLDAYFHLQLSANLHDIHRWLSEPGFDLMALILVPLIVTLFLAVWLVLRHGARGFGLAVYALAQVAALLLFGLRQETRDLLELVPFLCLAGMMATRSEWGAAATVEPTGIALSPKPRQSRRHA